MGLLTDRVERSEIEPGDHIYAYRGVFTYSHHGIFVGGNKVVHFSPNIDLNSSTCISSNSGFCYSTSCLPSSCCTFHDCGFRQPNSGVVCSCLDCFLRNGSLCRFKYGVSLPVFLAQVQGGTCSMAKSDPPEEVIHRAMYLLQTGFGNYDLLQNNWEDFALYCKTGLLTVDKKRTNIGKTGDRPQEKVETLCSFSSVIGAPLAAIFSSPLTWLMSFSVSGSTVTVGMYCINRYITDIGVRADVIKVAVEDLADLMKVWHAILRK